LVIFIVAIGIIVSKIDCFLAEAIALLQDLQGLDKEGNEEYRNKKRYTIAHDCISKTL
jgi:hypothetical protein